MHEDNQKTISVDLTLYELNDLRYYLYSIINQDSVYTTNYINFAKNLFQKLDEARENYFLKKN